jgi:hypothetical protein
VEIDDEEIDFDSEGCDIYCGCGLGYLGVEQILEQDWRDRVEGELLLAFIFCDILFFGVYSYIVVLALFDVVAWSTSGYL